MADEKSKVGKDYELDWIYGHYEDGESVAKMAKILGRSESYVYAQMKQKPQEYEDIKKFLEEKYNRRIDIVLLQLVGIWLQVLLTPLIYDRF